MTRLAAYALILLGILFFAHAAYDEDRGVAMASAPTRGGQRYIIRSHPINTSCTQYIVV
jgi:hypothetical protein